jgi:hypothetical protein
MVLVIGPRAADPGQDDPAAGRELTEVSVLAAVAVVLLADPPSSRHNWARTAAQLHDIRARRSAVEYSAGGGSVHCHQDVQIRSDRACQQPATVQGEMRVPSGDQRYDRTAPVQLPAGGRLDRGPAGIVARQLEPVAGPVSGPAEGGQAGDVLVEARRDAPRHLQVPAPEVMDVVADHAATSR